MFNREQEIWEVLGIAPTTKKREVKKAYAEAVKHCHPEEEPEAFQKLYEAYQAALNICVLGSKRQPVLQQEDTSKLQIFSTETVLKSEETSIPESDVTQEDKKSYKNASQLSSQISYEKEQQKKLPYQENEQNPPSRDFNVEEKYKTLFAQNSQRQQEVLMYWESLWREYVANPSSHNCAEVLQFMYNRDFLLIRDLDCVPYQIAEFLPKGLTEIPKDFVYALWDIFDYQQYDTIADQVLYDSGYQKLYWILKKECDRYVEMSVFDKHGKLAKGIFLVGLFALIVIVSFGLTIRTNEIKRNRYSNRRAACAQVQEIIKEKYSDFILSGEMYPPNNTEREYIIETKIRPKREFMSNEQSIRVTIVEDAKGNMVSYSDDFESRSIQMLANKYGLRCSISLKETSKEKLLSIELEKADTVETQKIELENIYTVLQKDTIQNLSPSTITFYIKDTTKNNQDKRLQYTFSDLPNQEVLLEEIWE
jgi:DnaJ-class molecular chaperone with C-terminal Zn finger domain